MRKRRAKEKIVGMSETVESCVCGHNIHDHEDSDFDIHECNANNCNCQQFLDADEMKKIL